MKKRLLGFLCLALTGCPPNKPPEAKKPAEVGDAARVFPAEVPGDAPAPAPTQRSSLDPQPEVPVVINLSVYHVAVPAGSISGSAAFWKHLDENRLDVDTKDLMQFNGFRIGLAPQADWGYFKEIFSQQVLVSQKTGGTAVNGPAVVEMPFRQNIGREYIAWFDPSYRLAGQTYADCGNFMVVRFEPVRRTPGTVRVKLSPMVRAQRTEIRYTALERPVESLTFRPEFVWDLLSQIDIPLDHFLVVAPTPDKDDGPTLGHRFLLADGAGEPSEHLLLISPQPFRYDDKPTTKAVGP